MVLAFVINEGDIHITYWILMCVLPPYVIKPYMSLLLTIWPTQLVNKVFPTFLSAGFLPNLVLQWSMQPNMRPVITQNLTVFWRKEKKIALDQIDGKFSFHQSKKATSFLTVRILFTNYFLPFSSSWTSILWCMLCAATMFKHVWRFSKIMALKKPTFSHRTVQQLKPILEACLRWCIPFHLQSKDTQGRRMTYRIHKLATRLN